jgi:hypothetical protein
LRAVSELKKDTSSSELDQCIESLNQIDEQLTKLTS